LIQIFFSFSSLVFFFLYLFFLFALSFLINFFYWYNNNNNNNNNIIIIIITYTKSAQCFNVHCTVKLWAIFFFPYFFLIFFYLAITLSWHESWCDGLTWFGRLTQLIQIIFLFPHYFCSSDFIFLYCMQSTVKRLMPLFLFFFAFFFFLYLSPWTTSAVHGEKADAFFFFFLINFFI